MRVINLRRLTRAIVLPSFVVAVVALLTTACGDPAGPDERVIPVVHLLGGSGQTALVSGPLPAPIFVRVTNSRTGEPLAGVTVEWRTLPGNGTLLPIEPKTDQTGDAVAQWILGDVAKPDTGFVIVEGAPPLIVTATAVAELPSPPLPSVVRIDVSPVRYGGVVGETLRFTAIGREAEGYIRDVPVEWSVVVGDAVALEVLDSASARVTTTKLGQVTVRATLVGSPSVVGQAVVNVGAASDFASVRAAGPRTCALTSAGVAYCWGHNMNEWLGASTLDGCPLSECNRTPVAVRGGLRFASLGIGLKNICALTSDEAAYCWGDNLFGQMGDGAGGNSFPVTEPKPAAGALRFASLAVGASHVCGLTAAGKAYCWGQNDEGQLGVGDAPLYQSFEPLAVAGDITFAQLSGGDKYTCGVSTTGEGYCWGTGGGGGVLGNGIDRGLRTVPTRVAGTVQFKSIVAGEQHTCGLAVSGKAYCWGINFGGALGGGSASLYDELAPAAVATDVAFTQIAAGSRFTCALATTGQVYCWGTGDRGRLGRGDQADSGTPLPVSGGDVFTSIGLGRWHACATRSDGRAFCWGDGYDGALGNGTMEMATRPRAASIPF